jgi:hypothetical protein
MKPAAVFGYWAGLFTLIPLLTLLWSQEQENLHASGPANTGHETLSCIDCHRAAPGSFRQQIQANLRYWLGLRSKPVDFQFLPVTNNECRGCHDRPNDNHPAHRFLEPRFAKARANISAHKCVSCHQEHQGVRVTIEPTFCVNCHQKLKLKKDPLPVFSHAQLIAGEKWASCMGCHDFHGNHIMKVTTALHQGIKKKILTEYFEGGPSPYSKNKQYSAKEKTHE